MLAVSGACMLYPIGNTGMNVVFVLVKICMVTGLLVFLYGKNKNTGLNLWTCASVLACVCTIVKWTGQSDVNAGQIILYIGSMIADLGMPAILRKMWKKEA